MKLDIIKILQDLGFTEYESKTYLALLEKSPISGYAVALISGVPRSKIYEVLGGLVARGEVIMSPGNTALYSPLPPKELLEKRRRKAETTLDLAQNALEQYIYNKENRENIWNITGRKDILDRVREVIRNAKGHVLVEIWKEDAEELKEEFMEASKKGVEILIVAYGNLEFSFVQVYQHDLHEEITSEWGGRWIVLSADDREIVAGIVSLGDDSRAAWTMHPGLVMPMTEVIKHDLYIMEMLKEHRVILETSFGPNLIHLRNRFKFGSTGVSAASKLGLLK